MAKLKGVALASVSPRGRHVAYTLAVQRNPLDEEDGPAFIELHVADAAGYALACEADSCHRRAPQYGWRSAPTSGMFWTASAFTSLALSLARFATSGTNGKLERLSSPLA